MTGKQLREINNKAKEASKRAEVVCFSDASEEEFEAALNAEEAAINALIAAVVEYTGGVLEARTVERLVMLKREQIDALIAKAI